MQRTDTAKSRESRQTRALAALASTCALSFGGCSSNRSAAVGDAGEPTLAMRQQAATAAATGSSACTALPAFYWEIGDANGALASGKVGLGFDADTAMNIASASKLVFGAYVVERFESDLGSADFQAMTMRSGYTSLSYASCVSSTTVDDCLATGSNGIHTPSEDGLFHYDGGHFQHYASTLGLGADDDAALATAMGAMLGPELGIAYSSPQLAAGMHVAPSTYALFLRKILSGSLAIRDHLGENAVCTLPSVCPQASYSPSPEAWHYSWGHWVEDDATAGNDGAFSSPGAFGFYPWIDAGKTYYGILARVALSAGAATESTLCGQAIREAFLTGRAP